MNKYVQIRGANFGVNPNTGSRGSESVIQPATSDPDPYSPTAVTILYIGSNGSGSSIDGFIFDGDNTTITSAVNINGANIDAIEAISAFDGLSNTTVSNNIIQNLSYTGIDYYNDGNGGASTYDNIITDNKFDNIDPISEGLGVLIYNNCYSSITNNVMTRVRLGIQTGNFHLADLGTNHSISGNTIESYRLGIYHNLAYQNATAYDISNNILNTMTGAPNNGGIELSSIQNSVGVNVTNNNINDARKGYTLWNCPTSNTVTITGGTLTDCQAGVFAHNYDDLYFDAASSVYAMTGVTITNCDTAIWVQDNNLNTNNATVALNINNTTNIVSGSGLGLLIEGGDATASFNGAIPVDFSTSLSKYIRLITNGSNVPSANINAQNVNFGGANGSALTNAQLFAVEDKMDHKVDWSSLGFVSVKAFNNYVTLNSFYTPNTSVASIQNGIDISTAGDTVNVDAGTFNENILLNKAVSLIGSGPSSTTLTPSVACTGDGVNITSSNANLKDLKVTNYNYGLRTSSSAISIYNVESVSNCSYAINTGNGTNGLTIVKCKFNNNTLGGWRAGGGDIVNNVIMDSCEVKGNSSAGAGYGTFIGASTNSGNTFDNITIKNSDFSNNLRKGMYFEKLSNALIDNVIIDNSGTDVTYGFNNGIDINLKNGTYSNITIQNSSITNCGSTGTAGNIDNPAAVTIKARDDPPTYIAYPATLTTVIVKNCFISGPVNGLRFGEFDKTNNSPTGNTVIENHFGNGYSNKAILNKTANNISVSCNWYGTAVPAAVVALHGSNLSFLPYLTDGTDNDVAAGFQIVPGSCDGAGPVKNLTQTTSYIAIAPAINAANLNDVIEISAGSYNERVVIDKSLTLQGVNEANCIITGTGLAGTGKGIQISSGITDVIIKYLTVQNFTGAGGNTDAGIYGIAGNNNLLIEHVTIQNNPNASGFYANGPVNNVTLDYVTSSGHGTGARGIVIWNGLKENITITNCEVFNNNCCGVELQDGQASGVIITDNNIHDNADNGIGLMGLQGPGENLVKMNVLTNNGRFGIEIKNPNGSGLATGAGRVVIENNTVSRTIPIVDARDICGIAALRISVLAGNVDVPNGTVIQNNIVSGYIQPTTSEGFGIVVEGTNHTVSTNTVSGCDVGIQRQAGHLPYPGNGDQSNLADTYFGRGNSPITCGVTLSGNILSNAIDTRDVGAGSGIVKNNNTNEIFCSIQAAIDDAGTLDGHVIDVDSAYYNESVVINKQVTLVGNGGSPNSRPTVEGVTGQTFSVTVPNVTIDNVIVKFNQGLVNTGILAATSGSFDNLTVKNSCVFGTATTGAPIFNSFGIQLGTFGGVLYDQVNLDDNEIKHTGTSPIGRGVKTFNCYGDWKNSNITGFYSIQSGDIQGGILNITDDTLKGETEINYLGTGTHSFSNNVCMPSNSYGPGTDFALLELKNISLAGSNLTISGNTFQSYVNFGLFSGRSNNVTIDNNTFTPDVSAVNFRSIRIDTKQRTAAAQTAFASGAVITNNTFNGNVAGGQAGISVELANSDNVSSFGTVTLGNSGNENDFNINVNKNISLNNETGSTSGDPVWAPPSYVSTKAKVNLDVDGKNNTYNVGAGFESPAAMSLANLFLLEDKIQHKIDDSGIGFVTVKANNDYVTVNSFVSPATTTPSIQRGIDASSASWTVNVNDGTYNEDIDINKAIGVLGFSPAAIIRGLYAGSANTVFMSASNSSLRNVTVTRDYGANLVAWNASGKNQGINVAQTTTGITINKVTLTANRNAIFVNNAQNVTITQCTIEDNRTGVHFGNNFSGAEVHNNIIRNNFTHGVLFNYELVTGIVATNVHVTNNSITGNWYSQVNFQRNSGPVPTGDHTGLSFSCNWYGTTMPAIVAANAAEPGYTSQTPSQFGGTDPGLNRQLYGIEIGKCPYMPWLTDGTDNANDTAGFQTVDGACNGLLSKLYVNDNSLSDDVFTSAVGNDANLGTPGSPFATIAYAVSVASDRDTIYVDAGTFIEQVNINKSLTIIGADSAGPSAATIKAPAVLNTVSNANASDHTPVVYASGADTVNISHICVDGDGRGGAKFSGVYYYESSGTFSNSKIVRVRDAVYSGVQSGNAFFANHTYDASFNQKVTVTNNVIEDYQKTGILINELNTHGIVTNNIITGQSIQHVNGQNGIQFGYGAYGTITGNTVTGNQYNGPASDAASGILLAGVGVDASNIPTGQTTTIGGAGALANIMNGNEVGLLTDGGGYGYDSNAGVVYNANTFNVNYIHVSESAPNTIPSGSNVYDKRIDNPAQTNVVYGQIQRSVDDADANDILNVSAHVFTEQVEIHKAVTLAGQGSGLTTIVSPNTLPLSFMTGDINKPIIYVHDTSDVVIKNLTVDGAGKGNANYRFQGIAFRNAGGKIRGCEIKDIRETPINGNQHGVGIYVYDDNGTARTLEVVNNTITGFQKNATALLGADLNVRVDSNIITGAGPINFIAQNGIQLSTDATGSISHNTVSGFSYTPGSYLACAILLDQPSGPVTTSDNIISASQMGIFYYQVGGIISGNTINATAASVGQNDYWGIDADPGDEPHLKIQSFDAPSKLGLRQGNSLDNMPTTTTSIYRNTLTSDGTHGTAIIMVALGTDVLNVNATENIVNSWEAGVVFDKDAGATLNGVVNYNDLSGNVYALYDFTGVTQNATCNWYGTTDNSVIAPTVSGSVNYIPYLTNGSDNYVDTAGFQPVPASCNGIPATTINIKVIQEGFYNANEKLNISDTVKAYLHSSITPFNVLDTAVSVVDSVTFTGSFSFSQPSGTYYIVVKHRNTIETWSKTGGEVFISGSVMNYDFTDLASKAFQSNMIQVDNSPVRFAVFSGDVNQDGSVETLDLSATDNDALNFVIGYVSTDVNGDYVTDALDLSIIDNNAYNFVSKMTPP